ncbi:MAG: PQQ-binding-like beta-propeller repeat protein, partial [Armatimonadetes bacterium]|nr:PQQ-binding-like beta-propeller repeat protein [Armatimonadota bacterium]
MRVPKWLGAALIIGYALCAAAAVGSDWPMWRGDPHRSGVASDGPAGELQLQWRRDLPPYAPAWPHEPRLDFDACYEPVVAGGRVLIGSPLDGSIRAFGVETGEELWRFHTEGPVRFAPVVWEGKIYAGSDDGWLYCLAADSGALLWRVRGAPDDRDDWRHLGNARLISCWPVRCGPVVDDGVVYFSAGIWPTLGVFVKALDAETGETLWTNGDIARLENVRVDHNAIHEAGLSPQGYLLKVGRRLVVPNGRSMPARFDAATGRMLYYVQGYRNGDCRVVANDRYAFVGRTGVMNMSDGREVGSQWVEAGDEAPAGFDSKKFHLFEGPFHPYKFVPACDAWSVVDGEMLYGLSKGIFYAYDLGNVKRTTYEKSFAGHALTPIRWEPALVWKFQTEYAKDKPAGRALVKAGDRLYAQVGGKLVCVVLPGGDGQPQVAWTRDVEGTPGTILAAEDRLFVVTGEGRIYCFGAAAGEPVTHSLPDAPLQPAGDYWVRM